ncbi:hypothetical protein Tco_1400969 [Tanacetum coccineum]
MPRKKFNVLAQHLQEIMEESLPTMVDDRVKELTKKQVPLYLAEGLIMEREKSQTDVAKMISDAIQQERENLRSEITLQINDAIFNHIPSDNPQLQQDDLPIWFALKYKFERLRVSTTPCRPSAVRPRDQDDPHDDAHHEEENSAKRQKTSEPRTFMFGESSSSQDFESEQDDDEIPNEKVLQELVDEMSHTVDETKLRKVVDEIDPKAPALSLVNQDLLYLKKGSSGLEKIVMSLHKFHAVIFPDDDIEERTSIWVDKCVKKFNPYARYNVEHWKNPLAKIFYIKKQKELGKPNEIVARRANGSIVSITESNYKNLKKNDIKDMYLLIVNHKVDDSAKAGLLWSLSVFIRNTNSKKEKRMIRHQEIHKFCDATLKRVLKGLKSYNNNVNHGYVTPSLSNEDAKYLQLFEEEIKEQLKHHD